MSLRRERARNQPGQSLLIELDKGAGVDELVTEVVVLGPGVVDRDEFYSFFQSKYGQVI